jgi:glycosyltransferase involved in cell wall biosynthesis
MASEKVAIGCKRQGIEEIIRHGANGWLVEPESVDDLEYVMSKLMSDHSLRNNIAKAGRRTCLEGLTLSHQAQRFEAIYREIAG